eukprot:gene3604-13687_t
MKSVAALGVTGSRGEGWHAVNLIGQGGIQLTGDVFDSLVNQQGDLVNCTADEVLGAAVQGFSLPTHRAITSIVLDMRQPKSNADAIVFKSGDGSTLMWNVDADKGSLEEPPMKGWTPPKDQAPPGPPEDKDMGTGEGVAYLGDPFGTGIRAQSIPPLDPHRNMDGENIHRLTKYT